MAVVWRALWVGEGFNPAIVKEAKRSSGAYAIRGKQDHVVRYVGESSRGVLWKTLVRHFQAPDSFAQVRETGIFTGDPRRYEVALHVTSTGPRPRAPAEGSKPSKRLASLRRRGVRHTTKADQAASEAQRAWIASMKPTKNRDDGTAAGVDAAEDFRAHRARQEAEDADRGFAFNPGGRVKLDPLAMIYFGRTSGVIAYRKASAKDVYASGVLADDRGPLAFFDNQTRDEEPVMGRWLVAAIKAARAFRSSPAGEFIPSEMSSVRDTAAFWVAFARAMPKTPAKVSDFNSLPWDVRGKRGATIENTPEGGTVLTTRDEQVSEALALLANLARFGEVLRKVPAGATPRDVMDRSRDVRRKLEGVEERRGAAKHLSDLDWRRAQIALALQLEALDLAYDAAHTDGGNEIVRAGRARTADELLRAIEAGRGHSLAVEGVSLSEAGELRSLIDRGLVRLMPARGSWAARYVITSAGSHALGTFASADASFYDDAADAGAAARKRMAAVPAGFGTVGKRGQLVMFNPGGPSGALTLLGLLTCLVVLRRGRKSSLRWSLKGAPLLAYDGAGRLFIVYRGKVEGASTKAQQDEYNRTHWGQLSGGKLLGGGVAVGPFLDVGDVTEITYTTKKGSGDGGKLVDWVHEVGEGSSKVLVRPRLLAHDCKAGRCGPRCAAKDSLTLSGGSYSVTERGIVG